jgi:hypothetical protein
MKGFVMNNLNTSSLVAIALLALLGTLSAIAMVFLMGTAPINEFCYAETSCHKGKIISCQIVGENCTAERGHGWVECTQGDRKIEKYCPTYSK